MAGKRKKKKKKTNNYLLISFAISSLVILLTLGYLVSINYYRVKKFIEQGHSSSKFVIYSAAKNYYQGQKSDLGSFINILRERGYTLKKFTNEGITGELTTNTDNKSYYQDQEFIYLEIPAFINEKNEKIPSRKVRYNPYSGKINALDQGPDNFQLEPLPIYIRDGQSIRSVNSVDLDSIPKKIQDVLLAIEDRDFYSHYGIDLLGTLRALFVNLQNQRLAQGGSTITQQLAKNLFLNNKKTFFRKFNEAICALLLEFNLSKREILELYLNESYFGQQGNLAIHGVKNAAKAFFDKSLQNLNISEQVALVSILQAPTLFSPWKKNSKIHARKNELLQILKELNLISEPELSNALNEKLNIAPRKLETHKAPYFIQALFAEQKVKQVISEHGDLALSIYTGLDNDIQNCAEEAIQQNLYKINLNRKLPLNAALIALEPHSGAIRAWVGGENYKVSQFDNVIQAQRQMASLVKPFVYLLAFEKNRLLNANSLINDQEFKIKLPSGQIWSPNNYDHKFLGKITLRQALEQSRNIPAVKLANKFGFEDLANFLRELQINSNIQPLPSLALGAIDTTLFKIAQAYSLLANDGIFVPSRLFNSIRNKSGNLIVDNSLTERAISNPESVFLVNDILKGAVDRGTGSKIRKNGFNAEIAGKTGTSNNGRDAWFVGYTSKFLAAIWLGEKNNSSTGSTGGGLAAPIWGDFMKCLEPSIYETEFIRPRKLIAVKIDQVTGDKFTDFCPKENLKTEYFKPESQPKKFCEVHSSENKAEAIEVNKLINPKNESIKTHQQRKSFAEYLSNY